MSTALAIEPASPLNAWMPGWHKPNGLTFLDIFCGAGGSSIGLAMAGFTLVMAANHLPIAIETHSYNFSDADHLCADVSNYDMRKLPKVDVAWFSPECFPAGTLILTQRGLIPIEDIRIGDLVFTHQQRWRPVTSTMSRKADTVILSGQGHAGLETTTEHPFYARQASRQWINEIRDYRRAYGAPEWVRAGDMAGRHWASVADYGSPLPIPPVPGRGLAFDADVWWLIGRWLGDGSSSPHKGEVSVCCGLHESDDLEKRLNSIAELRDPTRRAASGELRWRRRDLRTGTVFSCGHVGLVKWLTEHFGRHAHGKQLPAWALTMPETWRASLLEGYLSADGCTRRLVQAGSVSKRLAVGIRLLALSLGHNASLWSPSKRTEGVIEGRRVTMRPMWTTAWTAQPSAKHARTLVEDGIRWSAVKEVRPGRTGVQVFNLSVAEDESYVADGIVVHNCTWHSPAGGRKRLRVQLDLFDEYVPTDAGVRSRATMLDVIRATEAKQFKVVIVENVVEVADWPLYEWWLRGMAELGYEHQVVCASSAHIGGDANPHAPQYRDRIFIVFRQKQIPAFRLDPRPLAWCFECEQQVEAVQAWRNLKRRRIGKYAQQYDYRCPNTSCRNAVVEPYVMPAAAAIDWSNVGTRIGDRTRPLAANTIARIEAGLDMFARAESFITMNRTNNRPRPVDEPLAPLTTGRNHGLTTPPPFVVNVNHDSLRAYLPDEQAFPTRTVKIGEGIVLPVGGPNHDQPGTRLDEPMRTRLVRDTDALVLPPFLTLFRSGRPRNTDPASEPLATVVTEGSNHGLVQPEPFVAMLRNHGTATSVNDPLSTVTAAGRHHALVIPYRNAKAKTTAEPLHTVATIDSAALVQPAILVEDCFFRMLQPREHLRAQRFPDAYQVKGNKSEQTLQAGNAVSSNVAQWIGERVAEVLCA